MVAQMRIQAGVQLLHSLIYLLTTLHRLRASWGSTLTLPDILESTDEKGWYELGFNSYTP